MGAFLKEEIFATLDQLKPEQRSEPKRRAPKFLTSGIPQMRLKMGHFSLTSEKDLISHGVQLPLENMG